MKLYYAIRFIILIALFAANHLVKADVDYPVTRNLRATRSPPPAPRRHAPVNQRCPKCRSPPPKYKRAHLPAPPSIRF